MGQQPRIVVPETAEPRPVPEPGPAKPWRADKPGVPESPEDWPHGGHFETTGPDPGWALRL
ncbi:MAG: hypothetical protein ACRDVL_08930, partial [Acidimicrobiia bacterium]